MKLWAAVSAFRDEPTLLAEVLGDRFRQFDELVAAHNRAVLDEELPLELTREIASRYSAKRFVIVGNDLRVASAESKQTLSALDVHDRFGGAVIERSPGVWFGSTHHVPVAPPMNSYG